MLLALSDARIDFLLVGAYAVAAHGHPRATGDLDLWVRPDAETAPKVYRVLADFGAPLHDLIVNKRACGRPKDIADAETLDPTDS